MAVASMMVLLSPATVAVRPRSVEVIWRRVWDVLSRGACKNVKYIVFKVQDSHLTGKLKQVGRNFLSSVPVTKFTLLLFNQQIRRIKFPNCW